MNRAAGESKNASTSLAARAAQIIFLAWLLFVNLFYYFQFRELFLARFGAWIHKWR
jgi:hypothetical protein